MLVSVIVPVRNEGRSIAATLRTLLDQDFTPGEYEVLVVDGFSTDHTCSVVRKMQADHPNLKLLYNPHRLSSAARNIAVRHMRGRYAVVVDGHCRISDRGYLRHLVNAFEVTAADCLGRPQPLDAPYPTAFQQAVSAARQSRLGHNPDSDIFSDRAAFVPPQNTAVAYRRELFNSTGLFDQSFDACEDVEFNSRVAAAGKTCFFEPKLKVAYHPRGNWSALFKQLGRYGRGRARLAAKDRKSLTLPALVPPLWVLWLIAAPIVCLAWPQLWTIYLGLLAVYLGAILAFSARLALRRPVSVGLRLPAVFIGIHLGFAWGFWSEAVRRKK